MRRFGIAIHGGAGAIPRETMTADLEAAYLEGLGQALAAGYGILERDGSALDAVEAAVLVMEESPLFNAGKGAVFTHDGTHEQDASIMDGRTLRCGAVAGLERVRNPIRAARAVMERSEHVLLAGRGAETFLAAQGLEMVDPGWFSTERRREQLERAKTRERERGVAVTELSEGGRGDDSKHGTVGAVALDRAGGLAAATSSGGMTNKRGGRIGDSAIVGAGTYANETCAVSTTGHGEYFIRAVTAYDLAVRVEHRGLSLAEAADEVIHDRLAGLGGTGGLAAIDARGHVALPYNSRGMYRGHHVEGADPAVAIFES